MLAAFLYIENTHRLIIALINNIICERQFKKRPMLICCWNNIDILIKNYFNSNTVTLKSFKDPV